MNKKVNEGLAELAGVVDQDHEVQMARADLYKIAKYAIKLHEMMKNITEAEGLEGWQQAKITKAADYIGSVYHSLEYDQVSGLKTESRKFRSAMTEAEQTEYKAILEKATSKAQQKFMDKDVTEAPIDGRDDDKITGGRRAVSPMQAKAWADDAADRNAQAIERMPEFFNPDHMRRIKKAAALINKLLGGKAIYINHRVKDRETRGPVTAIKVTYPTWPKRFASSPVKARELEEPLKDLGMIRRDNIKNKAGNNEPGIIFYFT